MNDKSASILYYDRASFRERQKQQNFAVKQRREVGNIDVKRQN